MTKLAGRLLVVACLFASACSGSSTAEPDVTAPPPASTPATPPPTSETTEAGSSTTTSGPSSTSTSTTSASQPTDGAPSLLDDLGPRLDSVPGVDSPGVIIELVEMVALFIPSEADPDDVNIATPLAEDIEIIEAYARAMQALYGQVTQNPIPVEPSAAMAATFLDGGAKYSENVFTQRNAAGQHLAFQGNNDVLRPVVLADPRSDDEAFIFDCAISGSRYVNPDGSLADGAIPGTELAPTLVRLVRVDGVWVVDDIQDDERACR